MVYFVAGMNTEEKKKRKKCVSLVFTTTETKVSQKQHTFRFHICRLPVSAALARAKRMIRILLCTGKGP